MNKMSISRKNGLAVTIAALLISVNAGCSPDPAGSLRDFLVDFALSGIAALLL